MSSTGAGMRLFLGWSDKAHARKMLEWLCTDLNSAVDTSAILNEYYVLNISASRICLHFLSCPGIMFKLCCSGCQLATSGSVAEDTARLMLELNGCTYWEIGQFNGNQGMIFSLPSMVKKGWISAASIQMVNGLEIASIKYTVQICC